MNQAKCECGLSKKNCANSIKTGWFQNIDPNEDVLSSSPSNISLEQTYSFCAFHIELTCATSARVSGVALSWNTSRNSLGLDVIQNSLADSTNCWSSCKLSSAYSGETEHFSMRWDAKSSIPRAHQLFACKNNKSTRLVHSQKALCLTSGDFFRRRKKHMRFECKWKLFQIYYHFVYHFYLFYLIKPFIIIWRKTNMMKFMTNLFNAFH